MKVLDLFCKAGGASAGLNLAGFDVTGVDIDPQPNYPFHFIQGDALPLDVAFLRGFDLIHASPPCQAFCAYGRRPGHVKPARNLISKVRKLLQASGVPYIIENVEGAASELRNPVKLCGSHFGLDVQRHRLFECSFPVPQPACDHKQWPARFPPATNRKNQRKTVEVGVWRIPLETQQRAMVGCAKRTTQDPRPLAEPGLSWMTLKEISEAIPPSYLQWLAQHVPAMED